MSQPVANPGDAAASHLGPGPHAPGPSTTLPPVVPAPFPTAPPRPPPPPPAPAATPHLPAHQLRRLRVPHTRAWYARLTLFEVLPRLLGVLLALLVLQQGLQWRDDIYSYTSPIRFRGDIQNAINQGNRVLAQTSVPLSKTLVPALPSVYRAWVKTYDEIYDQGGGDEGPGRYSLDYTPLRLMVAALWVRHLTQVYGPVSEFRDEYAQPLLHLNTACVLVAGCFGFLLTRHWLRRGQRAQGEPAPPLSASYASWRSSLSDAFRRHRPWISGLLVFAFIFLNTACLIDGHVFPQWDVWVLPFFFIACYAASRNWWTTAGAALLIGAMLKGQVLMVAPIFILWPLAQRRFVALLRFLLGAAAALALIVWPWLFRDRSALVHLVACVLAVLLLTVARHLLLPRRRRAIVRIPVPRPPPTAPPATEPATQRPKLATSILPTRHPESPAPRTASQPARYAALALIGLAFACVLTYPGWADPASPVYLSTGFLSATAALSLLGALAVLRSPWRSLPYLLLGCLAFATLLGGFRPSASFSWYAIGFAFPTEHYLQPAMGPTANLPAILGQKYRWGLKDPMVELPAILGGATLTLQTTFRIIHFVLVGLVGLAAAHHARRRSPRMLVCFAAPWVVMFAFMPQMHERYLVWGAAATALCAVLSVGGFALFLFTTFFASACIAIQCLYQNGGWWPRAIRFIQPMIPDGGYAVALIALVYVYWCLIPSPPRQPLRRVRPLTP